MPQRDPDIARYLNGLANERGSWVNRITSYDFQWNPHAYKAERSLKLALRDNVPAEVKAERLQQVQTLQKGISARRLLRWVGRDVEVLVEGAGRKGGLAGRTRTNKLVHGEGELPEGTFASMLVTGAHPHHLSPLPRK